MTTRLSLVILCLISFAARGQHFLPQARIWAMGNKVGLDFSNPSNPVPIATSLANTNEAAASVCDSAGQLLFYTNGNVVWNRNGAQMPNGGALVPSGGSTLSTTQGAVILPVIGVPGQYYIFSLTQISNCKLYVNRVDMSLNGGLGDVVTTYRLRNVSLSDSFLTEKMTSVAGCDNTLWLMVHRQNANVFQAYHVVDTGVVLTPVLSTAGVFAGVNYQQGVMKFSPDRSRLLNCNFRTSSTTPAGLELFDFDRSTGRLGNGRIIDSASYYGGSFSPNSSRVYANSNLASRLYQWDLSAASVPASKTLLGSSGQYTDLKLGPDGKIYFGALAGSAGYSNYRYMGRVNAPDNAGTACQFQDSVTSIFYPASSGQYGALAQGMPSDLAFPIPSQRLFLRALDTLVCGAFPAITLRAPAGAANPVWDDGSNGPTRTITVRGTYWVRSSSACDIRVDSFLIKGETVALPSIRYSASASDTDGLSRTLCAGEPLYLRAFPAGLAAYGWTGPNGFSSNRREPVPYPVGAADSGVYVLTVTGASGCRASASATIPVSALPAAAAASNSPVCPGDTLRLHGAPDGMAAYAWSGPNGFSSARQHPFLAPAMPRDSGTYTLTVRNAAGCVAVDSARVRINGLLVPTIVADTSLCAGQSIRLSAQPAGLSYSWSGPNGFSSAQQNPSVSNAQPVHSGRYALRVTSPNGCSGDASIELAVHIRPVAQASSNSPVCAGSRLTLSGSPAGMRSYRWTGPNGYASARRDDTLQRPSTAATGTYQLRIADSFGCADSLSLGVTVNPLPAVTVSSNSPVCSGDTIRLSGSAQGSSYQWNGPGGFVRGQRNASRPSAALADSGVYVLTVTNAAGCSGKDSVQVQVRPTPDAMATGSDALCAGDTIRLAAAPAGLSYSWSGPAGFSSTLSSPRIDAAQPGRSGTYRVRVTNGFGCGDTASVRVTVRANPVVRASGNGPVCSGKALVFRCTPGGLAQYAWSGPAGYQSNRGADSILQAQTVQGGIYVVTAKDGYGCAASDSVEIAVRQTPAAPVVTAPDRLCQYSPAVTLGASGNAPEWYESATGGIPVPTPVIYTDLPRSYRYWVMLSESGCAGPRVPVTVEVDGQPSAGLFVAQDPVCQHQPDTVRCIGLAPGTATVRWTAAQAAVLSRDGDSVLVVRFDEAGAVRVQRTLTNGACVRDTEIVVTVRPAAGPVSLTSERLTCIGRPVELRLESTGPVPGSKQWQFDGAQASGDSTHYTLRWTTPGTRIVSLRLQSDFCGTQLLHDTIDVLPEPVAHILADSTTLCSGETLRLRAEPSYFSEQAGYAWSPEPVIDAGERASSEVHIRPRQNAWVYLTRTNAAGCSAQDSLPVRVAPCCALEMPNAFTPNGDGRNDELRIVAERRYVLSAFRIANRWGQVVFETNDPDRGWNGRFDGQPQETGAYYYYLRYQCGNGAYLEQKGEVTLVR